MKFDIIDISNPTSPSLIKTLDSVGYSSDFIISKDETKIFLLGWNELQIIDITNPISPFIFGDYINNSKEGFDNIVISKDEDTAFLIDYNNLIILDISF